MIPFGYRGLGARLTHLFAYLLIVLCSETVWGQTPNEPLPALRKIFVPADSLDAEIRDMLPMQRKDFDRRWAAIQAGASANSGPPGASLTQGVYRASLRGEALTGGTAELQIERRQTGDEGPAWLTLLPCNLALSSPRWKTAGSNSESLEFGNRESGELVLAVPRSGELQYSWSLSGRRAEGGRLLFDIAVPPAPKQRLELSVPSNWRLTSDFALVRETKAARATGPANGNEAPGDVNWTLELPSNGRCELRFEPRTQDERTKPLILVRETAGYVFSPGQMDLELSLELDIDRAPLRVIRVPYDPRLTWTAIRWGEQSLPWTTEKNASGEPVAVITLPEPIVGNSRLIQLTAVADWSPTPQKWSLPRASVEGAVWQEGKANVAAPRWLQLDALAGPGTRLTATTLASDSQGADLLQFQLDRSSGVVEVQTSSAAPPLSVTSLVTLQVEPKQLVALVAAEVTVTRGSQFTIECEIPRGWLLDTIETVPADVLEDRAVRPRGNLQHVTLLLKQPVRSSQPLRINARLRQARSGEGTWGDEILQPLRFVTAASQQRYLTLQLGDATFEPRLRSAQGIEFPAPASLPANVRALSDAPLGSWLVRIVDPAAQPRFLLAAGSPRYVADANLQINLAPQRADYRLSVHCQPESSAVSRVVIQLMPPPPADPLWRLNDESRPLAAERLESSAADMQAKRATYQLELPRSRDDEFTIEAQWSEAITAPTSAPLPELPEASSNTLTLEIAGPLDTALGWEADRLRPLPIPDGRQQVRARYRFPAGQEGSLKLLPLLDKQRTPAGWISRSDVDSEFSPGGAARHEARLVVSGEDLSVLEVRLGEDARLARAVVDGRDVLAYSRASDPRWFSIPLAAPGEAPRSKSPLVRLEYTSTSAASHGWLRSRWTASVPETRLPMLQSYWRGHLPRGWQLWPGGSGASLSNTTATVTTLTAFGATSDTTPIAQDLPSARVELDVFFVPWLALLALACGILAGAIVLRFAAWHATQLIPVALVLLSASLLLPQPWQVFLQAAWIGWLTGLAWLFIGSPSKTRTGAAVSTPTSLLTNSVLRACFVAGWLGCSGFIGSALIGKTIISAEEPTSKKTWRLVIPLGADDKPTDVVYVSDALHTELFLRGDARVRSQPDWLIRSAQYDVRWQAGKADMPGEFQGLVATLEVEVLREQSLLRLPILRDQVRISAPGVRIDGELSAADWTEKGDLLQIELPRVGRRKIEIGLSPVGRPKDGATGVRLRVPTVADSRVVIPSLMAGDQFRVLNARGAEQPAEGSAWLVGLGAIGELNLHWSHQIAEPAPVVETEQLLLWKLRPNSVVIDGKWQFRALSGKLREVVLRADPRYRLLPMSAAGSIARHWMEEGELNLHHFALAEGTTGDVALSASFLLVGSTGVGNLNPPRLEAVADRVKRDWQAAWLAPGMQWTGKPGTLPVAEFQQAWGDATLPPAQAFRATPEAPRPTLAVSASVPRLAAEERLDWYLAPDSTSVRIRLSGAVASPQINQLRFQLPPQWLVRNVIVSQGTSQLVARWFRHTDGGLTLLLDEVRAEPWQIEVLADRPYVAGKQTSLPVLVSNEMDIAKYQCVLRRRSGVEVTLGKLVGWTSAIAEEATNGSLDRIVTRLEWTGSRPGATPPAIPVTLTSGAQSARGHLFTRLRFTEKGPQAEVVAHLIATGQTFDELQFTVPRDWDGPFTIDPPATTRLEFLPGQSRNLLRVQLNQPVKDELRLTLSTDLAEEQEVLRLPVIDLIGNYQLERWIALPKSGGGRPLPWQTTGLQSQSALPEPLAGEATSDTALTDEQVYEVTAERYRATARPERARSERPRIVLADHQVVWQNDGRTVGRSEFTILPGGARSILVHPPESHELVAAIVNGVPAPLRAEPGISGAATVELHSDSWPQWVQIIYRGRLPAPGTRGGDFQLVAPRVARAPVDWTRWQVAGPRSLIAANPSVPQRPAAEGLLAPVEALARIARGVADTPGGSSAEANDTWLRLWREHWARESAGLVRKPPQPPLPLAVTTKLQELESELADILVQPIVEVGDQTRPGQTRRAHELELFPATDVVVMHPLQELKQIQMGDMPTWNLSLAAPATPTTDRWNWLIAACLIGGAITLTQVGRLGALRDWLAAYPQLTLALAGCGAILIPGYLWLGTAMLAVALVSTLHSPWKQRA